MDCPATPPDLPKSPTPETTDDESLDPNDKRCSICLANYKNVSYIDGCKHRFCYLCIVEWSKVRAVCPLCKVYFKTIYYGKNFQSTYVVPETQIDSSSTNISEAFLFDEQISYISPWMENLLYRVRPNSHLLDRAHSLSSLLLADLVSPQPHQQQRSRIPHPHHNITPTASSSSTSATPPTLYDMFRRGVYEQRLWALPCSDTVTGRFRECSPQFYAANPACMHRLMPWITRELHSVPTTPRLSTRRVNSLARAIVRLLPAAHMRSSRFVDSLRGPLGEHVTRFVHELYNFARSPYDMLGYNDYVHYTETRPHDQLVTLVGSSSDEIEEVDEVVVAGDHSTSSSSHPPPTHSASSVAGVTGANSVDCDDIEIVDVLPPKHMRAAPLVDLSYDSEDGGNGQECPAAPSACRDQVGTCSARMPELRQQDEGDRDSGGETHAAATQSRKRKSRTQTQSGRHTKQLKLHLYKRSVGRGSRSGEGGSSSSCCWSVQQPILLRDDDTEEEEGVPTSVADIAPSHTSYCADPPLGSTQGEVAGTTRSRGRRRSRKSRCITARSRDSVRITRSLSRLSDADCQQMPSDIDLC